jgi:hypothetical protein
MVMGVSVRVFQQSIGSARCALFDLQLADYPSHRLFRGKGEVPQASPFRFGKPSAQNYRWIAPRRDIPERYSHNIFNSPILFLLSQRNCTHDLPSLSFEKHINMLESDAHFAIRVAVSNSILRAPTCIGNNVATRRLLGLIA